MSDETSDETALVEYHPTIRDLPVGERPRERLEHYGAGALSTSELIAILLRSGVTGESVLRLAERLLVRYGGLTGLAQASFAELQQDKGIGPAKVTQIKAALELGRRLLVASPHERPQIKSPADAANLLMLEMGLLQQEQLRVMLLDTRNRVLATHKMYVGNLNTSVVRVGEIFREAIKKERGLGFG
jgi:DNA repair protein RadC